MNNLIAAPSNGSAPNGITTARDCEYVVYSSLAGSIGHRLVYHNTSVAEDSFNGYNTTPEYDYLQFIIQGAAVSTAVLQLTVSYQVEYTINSNVLVELEMPPPGTATVKAIAQALAYNPQLRLIGKQEATELFNAMLNCRPTYTDALNLLTNYVFKHNFTEYHVSPYGGNDQSARNDGEIGTMRFSDYSLQSS